MANVTFTYTYSTVIEGSPYLKQLEFPTLLDMTTYAEGWMGIKNASTRMNVAGSGSSISDEACCQRVDSWLARVHRFSSVWGYGRVPHDIRIACHSFQEFRNVPLTDFGPDEGVVSFDG